MSDTATVPVTNWYEIQILINQQVSKLPFAVGAIFDLFFAQLADNMLAKYPESLSSMILNEFKRRGLYKQDFTPRPYCDKEFDYPCPGRTYSKTIDDLASLTPALQKSDYKNWIFISSHFYMIEQLANSGYRDKALWLYRELNYSIRHKSRSAGPDREYDAIARILNYFDFRQLEKQLELPLRPHPEVLFSLYQF